MYPIATSKNCLCVIVTFNPDDAIAERLTALADLFEFVLIVDNSSDNTAIEQVARYARELGFFLISNRLNIGLAAALNQGFKLAERKGLLWCVFFDQDTEVSPSFLGSSQACMLESKQKAAIIGNNYVDKHSGVPRFHYDAKNTTSYKEAKTVITSGSIVLTALYESIGGYREDYFIDSIDHEYCLRARKSGYKVILSTRVTMVHSLGQSRAGRARMLSVPDHDPLRKYYICRNAVVTVKKYFSFDKVWCLKQIARLFVEASCILLFESRKYEKLTAMVRGVGFGIAGRMDEYR